MPQHKRDITRPREKFRRIYRDAMSPKRLPFWRLRLLILISQVRQLYNRLTRTLENEALLYDRVRKARVKLRHDILPRVKRLHPKVCCCFDCCVLKGWRSLPTWRRWLAIALSRFVRV